MISTPTIGKVFDALAKAQAQFKTVIKDKDNPFFKSKYADLAAGIDATQPALIANGLVVSQFPVYADGRVGVLTILGHSSGEYIGEFCTLPSAKQDAQTGVATITYMRRAAYLGVLGIAAEDDDGNTAAAKQSESKPSNPPKAEVPKKTVGDFEKPVKLESSDEQPTEEESKELRNSFKKLGGRLAEAGLQPDKGLPIGRKLAVYMLKQTGANSADQITKNQWNAFFDVTTKTETKELVRLVNEANGIEEKK